MPYQVPTTTLTPAKIKFDEDFPPLLMVAGAEKRQDNHDKLLAYLKARLDSGRTQRQIRMSRMSKIDKEVSTWQELSDQDTQRQNIKETTGRSQAIHMNMPVLHAHMEDMTSFFAEVFSPGAGDFFQLPKADVQESAKTLVDKLNNDAKQEKYYKELILTLRRILKYNIAGFEVEWSTVKGETMNQGRNRYTSIDLYNYLYDPGITDPSNIAKKAEWAATVAIRDQRYLLERTQKGDFFGVGAVINSDEAVTPFVNQMTQAEYYRYSPSEAGLTYDDTKTSAKRGSTPDWNAYGAGIASDLSVPVPGWEEVKMYCWLNPFEFGLVDEDPNDYQLWRFTILSGRRIVEMTPAFTIDDVEKTGDLATQYRQIPHYLGFLNVDDMGESQRSTAELLAPFASFASFLLNSHIDSVRSAIYGFTLYDPLGVDMDNIPKGEVAARVRSKMPGRDVRTIVQTINGNMPDRDTMADLQTIMAVMKEFFPAQALPSQIAGIDRAVTNQVSAVLQGVSRRLHMAVRVIDDDVMGPARYMSFVNIVKNQAASLAGLDQNNVMTILGSGLQQLNREMGASQIKELIFALIQNPEAAQGIDIMKLINWWSAMLNIPEDLSQFAKVAPAAPGTPAPTAAGTTSPVQMPPV